MSEPRPTYEVPLYPVAGWETGSSERQRFVLLRVLYLATPEDNPQSPHGALLHSLTPRQARALALELLAEAAKLEP